MSTLIIDTTDATFEQDVLQSEQPVLLDFWAPWCSPCKALTPMLERLATQYSGRVRIVKLNVDDNPGTATRFNVRSIPKLMLFTRGELRIDHAPHSQAGLKVLFDDLAQTASSALTDVPASMVAASVVPSFGGDPALKEDYLQRLRAATFDTDRLPADSVTTAAGAFAGTTRGPATLGGLLNGLWWTLEEPASKEKAHDWVVSLVEAMPVGIDLNRVALVLANWLLHDPQAGSVRDAPTVITRALCNRLAALHQRELDGEPVPESEWSALQREVVTLGPPPFDPETAGEMPDLSPDQSFLMGFEHIALPLAECELSNLFSASYSQALGAEMRRLNCWSFEDQRQMQSVYDATWKALSASLGERPAAEEAEALAQWEARKQSLRDRIRPKVRETHPELQARIDAWERIQQDLGSRMAIAVGAYFIDLCASAPRLAVSD